MDSLCAHEKYTKAEKECSALIASRRQATDPQLRQIFEDQRLLIVLLDLNGETAQAEKEVRALIVAEEHVLGAGVSTIVGDRRSLANLLYKQGKHAEAEKKYRAILATEKQNPSLGQMESFQLYQEFACCLEAQGKLGEALEFIKRAESELREGEGTGLQTETPYTEDLKRIEGKLKAMGLREGAK